MQLTQNTDTLRSSPVHAQLPRWDRLTQTADTQTPVCLKMWKTWTLRLLLWQLKVSLSRIRSVSHCKLFDHYFLSNKTCPWPWDEAANRLLYSASHFLSSHLRGFRPCPRYRRHHLADVRWHPSSLSVNLWSCLCSVVFIPAVGLGEWDCYGADRKAICHSHFKGDGTVAVTQSGGIKTIPSRFIRSPLSPAIRLQKHKSNLNRGWIIFRAHPWPSANSNCSNFALFVCFDMMHFTSLLHCCECKRLMDQITHWMNSQN